MRIGFVAWNKFQIAQIAPILKHGLADEIALLFQEDRPSADTSIVANPPSWCSVISITRDQTAKVDGFFDILLTQTALPEAAEFLSTKVMAVQYSMAKEQHQYGAWHCMTDARLCYGAYSHAILSFYGNSYPVGNPRFDVVFDGTMDPSIRNSILRTLDPTKRTILYAPTYGNLSSIDQFLPAVDAIGERFNLIISGHHNTMLREAHRSSVISQLNPSGSADIAPYYYSVADLVISDYSGAIFDAILCEKPVVLFRPGPSKIGTENLTEDSIEIARHGMIGPIVRQSEDLLWHIEDALDRFSFLEFNAQIRSECFVNIGRSGSAAYDAIVEHVQDNQPSPKAKQWVRSGMVRRYKSK